MTWYVLVFPPGSNLVCPVLYDDSKSVRNETRSGHDLHSFSSFLPPTPPNLPVCSQIFTYMQDMSFFLPQIIYTPVYGSDWFLNLLILYPKQVFPALILVQYLHFSDADLNVLQGSSEQ